MTDYSTLNKREHSKHPDATIDIRCSFADDLQPGETVVRTLWMALGLRIVAEQVEADGTVMVAWIAGGFDRARYTVTCSVLTSKARTLMRDTFLHVADDVPLPEAEL